MSERSSVAVTVRHDKSGTTFNGKRKHKHTYLDWTFYSRKILDTAARDPVWLDHSFLFKNSSNNNENYYELLYFIDYSSSRMKKRKL